LKAEVLYGKLPYRSKDDAAFDPSNTAH